MPPLYAVTKIALLAEHPPSYGGFLRIPVDLYTSEGARLERDRYEVELKPEKSTYILFFRLGDQVKATVKPVSSEDSDIALATIPLMGVHYLRSSAEPVLTAEERHDSKTGRAQYEEETRDWKAVVRVYKTPDDSAAYFVFQERPERRKWNRFVFKLFLRENTQGP